MSFCCIAKGSFHQGNEKLFPTSKNSQCTAISACALAWKTLRLGFSTAAIDRILITGDSIYNALRSENRMGGNRYLCPDELPANFVIEGQSVAVAENSFVHDALYPLSPVDMDDCVMSLSNVLQCLMAEDFQNTGFLFTGQTVTVAFWRSQEQLYLFDPHPVNEDRVYDLADDKNNLARLFQCENYLALASLLLSNAALDGSVRQFTVTRLKFGLPALSDSVPAQTISSTFDIIPQARDTISKDNKGKDLGNYELKDSPRVILSPVQSVHKRKAFGRPKKVCRGRPKLLITTRDEQVREANRRYVERNSKTTVDARRRYHEQHPEVHRKAVRRYSQRHPEGHRDSVRRYDVQHPEVNRDAVRHYSQQHPNINREAVQRYYKQNVETCRERVQGFRLLNPKLAELRHLPISLTRLIVAHGPMAHWSGALLYNINSHKLKKTCLWNDDVFICPHCQAPLFAEEEDRKKWCCGEGAYNSPCLQ
ncbi:hypothetical protein J6590_037482 [Homalodisca vitripennis]|nr:hypothetical protein J6590_037482 [Homalodisca vitripennis]